MKKLEEFGMMHKPKIEERRIIKCGEEIRETSWNEYGFGNQYRIVTKILICEWSCEIRVVKVDGKFWSSFRAESKKGGHCSLPCKKWSIPCDLFDDSIADAKRRLFEYLDDCGVTKPKFHQSFLPGF